MRWYNQQIFDDIITGTGTSWYSPADFNDLLGTADAFAVAAAVSAVSGTSPTLTVQAEHSCDGQNWNATASAEISTAIANDLLYWGYRYEETTILMSLVRFKITLGGTTPQCRLKLFATGRGGGRR